MGKRSKRHLTDLVRSAIEAEKSPEEIASAIETYNKKRINRRALAWLLLATSGISIGATVSYRSGRHSGERSQTAAVHTFASMNKAQKGFYTHIDPAIAAAATVQIMQNCLLGDSRSKFVEVSQGSGAIVTSANGSYSLATVGHVAETDFGLPTSQDCIFLVKVQSSDGKLIQFDQPVDSFTTTQPNGSRQFIGDPAVVAPIIGYASNEIDKAVKAGSLSPLVLTPYGATRSANNGHAIIYRQHGEVGPFRNPNGAIMIGSMMLLGAKNSLITYDMAEGQNTCHGNSGAPILEVDTAGRPTNRAVGVLSSALGGQLCGTEGAVAGFSI